jgi:DNA-binding beta-propeller fold protein YncE
MRKWSFVLVACVVFSGVPTRGQVAPPIKLVQTLELPPEVKGSFDHFGIDLKGGRLFATPEGYHAVIVFDLKTGKLIHKIDGIGKPHAVLYREDLDRIYITDGDAGDLKIFDGTTYSLVSSVKLLEDADSIGYDPATKYLYVDNGGGDVHQSYSMLSVIDTTAGKKLADLKIDGETLEAMALEKSTSKMYINNKSKNQVSVVDREKRELVASWPVTLCKNNVAMALDETHHRLFVACRTSQIAVLDTQTGKEVTSFPITKGVDDITYDAVSKRVYAACDGAVDVYEQLGPDTYKLLGNVPTGPMGRTARLVPEWKRYLVAVPQHDTTNAKVLVFDVL